MKNTKIIKICKQKFIFLNYSNNTAKVYINYIRKFIETLEDKQIIHCNSKDFQNYNENTHIFRGGMKVKNIKKLGHQLLLAKVVH